MGTTKSKPMTVRDRVMLAAEENDHDLLIEWIRADPNLLYEKDDYGRMLIFSLCRNRSSMKTVKYIYENDERFPAAFVLNAAVHSPLYELTSHTMTVFGAQIAFDAVIKHQADGKIRDMAEIITRLLHSHTYIASSRIDPLLDILQNHTDVDVSCLFKQIGFNSVLFEKIFKKFPPGSKQFDINRINLDGLGILFERTPSVRRTILTYDINLNICQSLYNICLKINSPELMELIRKKCGLVGTSSFVIYMPYMIRALSEGYLEAVNKIFLHHAIFDPNYMDSTKTSLLTVACKTNDFPVCNQIVSHHQYTNQKEGANGNSFIQACRYKMGDIAVKVFQTIPKKKVKKVCCKKTDRYGKTGRDYAKEYRLTEVLELLGTSLL